MDNTQNTQVPPQAPVPPPVFGGADNDKLMAILSYLGILILIPFLATKNRSAFLNFHLNQGLSLIIVAVAGNIVINFLPLLGLAVSGIWTILMIILVVTGIINANKNETKPLPVIGNWFHLVK